MLNHKPTHIIPLMIMTFFINICTPLASKAQGTEPVYHLVAQGETYYSISSKYQTSVDGLKSLNGFLDDFLPVGQQLIVGYDKVDSDSTERKKNLNLYEEIIVIVDELTSNALVKKSINGTGSIQSIEKLFQSEVSKDQSFDLINKLNDEKIKSLNHDLGLNLISSYTHNFAPEVLNAEESFFNSWISAGVKWDLLGNGFFSNRSKASELKKENAINQLLKKKSIKKENYTYLYNYLIYSFNKTKVLHLEERRDLITSFLEIASKLYYLRAVSWEEIIQWKSELQEIEETLNNLNTYNNVFLDNYGNLDFKDQMKTAELPVLEILLKQLIKGKALDSQDEQLLSMQQERLAIKYGRNDDLSLKAQFKVIGLVGPSSGRSKAYGSLNLSFSAPLFKNKRNQKFQERESAIIEQQLIKESTAVNNEVMNLYYQYEYSLKQFISFTGKKEKVRERIRKGKDRQLIRENDYSTISTFRLLNEMSAINFEMIDIKQKLYLQLLKIYTISNVESLSEFTQPAKIQNSFDKTQGNRGIYLWSNTYDEIGENFLLRYLINNDIDRVMFSPGKDERDVNKFLSKVVAEDKSIYRLIGENSYAINGFTESLRKKIENLNPYYEGIHLDVEPHALPDWDAKKDEYLNNFIEVLQGSRQVLSNDKFLSVSIPVFYSTDALEQIFKLADEVVLMAYGKTDVNTIIRKLSEELLIPGAQEKLTIALRASDFGDRIQMEALIDELMEQTGIQKFIIQDLGDLISLDQKTILGDITLNK